MLANADDEDEEGEDDQRVEARAGCRADDARRGTRGVAGAWKKVATDEGMTARGVSVA